MEPYISNVLYLFGNVFRIYLIYQFLKLFFVTAGTKLQKRVRMGLYIAFFLLNSVSFLWLQWGSTITLISNIAGVFIITLSYSGKWKYRIISPLLIITINLICEDLVYKCMIALEGTHIVVITIAVTDILLLMIALLLQKIVDFKQGEEVLPLEWIGTVFISIITVVISVVTLDKCTDEVALFVGGVGLLVLNIFVFYLFGHLSIMYRAHSQVVALEVQNRAYEKQLMILKQSEENISSIRHDMRNHILALQNIAQADSDNELRKYLDNMQSFLKPGEQFVCTGDALLDGLINLKLGEASKCNAAIKCNVFIEKDDLIDRIDLSILLGNLLDNAVQAVEKCKKDRMIELSIEEQKGVLYIYIKNSYDGIIRKMNKGFATVKHDNRNHGIGLKNVERIIDKYDGEIHFNYDQQWFSVEAMLFIN